MGEVTNFDEEFIIVEEANWDDTYIAECIASVDEGLTDLEQAVKNIGNSFRKAIKGIVRLQRKHYYRKPVSLRPPKLATCSSKRRGNPCKKKRK